MVDEARVKIYVTKGRHFIFLPRRLTEDSSFPFAPNTELSARVEDGRLVIENAEVKKKEKERRRSK